MNFATPAADSEIASGRWTSARNSHVAALPEAARGRIETDAPWSGRPDSSIRGGEVRDIRTRQRGGLKPETFRYTDAVWGRPGAVHGARRDEPRPGRFLDRSRDCRGDRGGRGAGGGIEHPGVLRKRGPATPSTPNKRPPAHVARHAAVAASDGTATASLGLNAAMRVRIVLVEGRRIAQQNSTARRPGPPDAAPGAADSLPFPLKKLPEAHPASLRARRSRGLPFTELLNTRPLTGPRAPAIACQPREDVARPFAGDGEVGKPEGGCGARPELRPEAPAGGARRRLPRHAHGALLRAGADRRRPARSRLQGPAGGRAEAQARRGAGQGVEAPGAVHRHGEEQDGARALVGETHRRPGVVPVNGCARHRQPRVRDQRGQEPGPRPGQAGAGRGRARRHGAAPGAKFGLRRERRSSSRPRATTGATASG